MALAVAGVTSEHLYFAMRGGAVFADRVREIVQDDRLGRAALLAREGEVVGADEWAEKAIENLGLLALP